jgi:hypothetical protein
MMYAMLTQVSQLVVKVEQTLSWPHHATKSGYLSPQTLHRKINIDQHVLYDYYYYYYYRELDYV